MSDHPTTQPDSINESPVPVVRALVGGMLMGLANLVPGVSGGTMLVASGVYDRFIRAIANFTRFRWKTGTLLTLTLVGLGAVLAIGIGAKGVSLALADFRWQTYSVFIGLTLGGVPAMITFCKPFRSGTWVGMAFGGLSMLALVWLQSRPAESGSVAAASWPMLIVGGAAGAGAMILPGVSGAYLLLLLGQYRTIIDSIRAAMSAATSGDVSGVMTEMGVLVPVGIGVVIGIVGISNLLRLALRRARSVTMGVLLGLLLAAPAGLWPFKQSDPPAIGDTFNGAAVTAEDLSEVLDPSNAKDWPEVVFTPSAAQLGISLALIAAGALVTLSVGYIGARVDCSNAAPQPESDASS